MGSLERGGAHKVINLPVKTGKGAAPGCLRGPCGPFSARGFCALPLPPRCDSQFLSGCCRSLFVIPSGCLQGPLSLCLLLSVYLFSCLSPPSSFPGPILRPKEF